MGDTSPSKSPPVRSPQPSIEHRSIQSQSPKLPSPVTLSPSAVSKRSVSANQAQSDSYLRRNSPLTIQTPEKIQPSSRQKSPAELAPGSPLQSRNLFSPRASIPEGPILQRNSASLRLSSTEQQRNSVSVREPTPDRPTSPFQRRNSASYQKSTPDKPPSPLQNRNSVSIKAYSPLQQRISPGSVRELSPDKTISLLQQRNSVRVNESATNRLSIPTEQRSPASAKKSDTLGQINLPIPITSEAEQEDPIEQESPESSTVLKEVVNLEPQGKTISEHMDELNETVKKLSESMENTPAASRNIDKIANMSQILSNEANALRNSIKSLSEDIARTKQDLGITYNETRYKEDDENLKKIPEHPHHLFLIELIVNRIQMKCECFDTDAKNLVITATFLARPPVVVYDNSCGKIEELKKINVGKSILSAMTYERICQVKRFQVFVEVSKQPPCSHCVTKIGETIMDFSQEFEELRNDLCKRWEKEKPKDDIICNASTPMMRNQYYLTCGDSLLENPEAIGLIEMSVRMSFLGKEITTVFGPQKDPSVLFKQNNGVTMYSCQKVEMDDAGKVLLDEALMCKSEEPKQRGYIPASRSESPISHSSISQYLSTKRYVEPTIPVGPRQAGLGEFRIRDLNDEINKLMREKRHWEFQIRSLGGTDHARFAPKMLDHDGKEVPGNRGYKYFGAAKDLPGVRELFEQEPPPPPRRTRADLMRDVDADYYGYRDDDDGLLMPLEKDAEKEAIARAVEEWKANKEQNVDQDLPEEEDIYPEDPDDKRMDDEDDDRPIVTTHVAVPSQKEIEEALLRKKKQELLERYGCLDVKIEGS